MSEAVQKRVSISSKRQFTIPRKFFTELDFGKDALCYIQGTKLIVEPIKAAGTDSVFAEQILEDLIHEGFEGKALLAEFKARQRKVRPAVERMLDNAKSAAHGKSEYSTYDDVFGLEE